MEVIVVRAQVLEERLDEEGDEEQVAEGVEVE